MSAKRSEPSGGFAPVFAAARGAAKVPKASGWSVTAGTPDGTCMVRTEPGCAPSAKVAAFDMVRRRAHAAAVSGRCLRNNTQLHAPGAAVRLWASLSRMRCTCCCAGRHAGCAPEQLCDRRPRLGVVQPTRRAPPQGPPRQRLPPRGVQVRVPHSVSSAAILVRLTCHTLSPRGVPISARLQTATRMASSPRWRASGRQR